MSIAHWRPLRREREALIIWLKAVLLERGQNEAWHMNICICVLLVCMLLHPLKCLKGQERRSVNVEDMHFGQL